MPGDAGRGARVGAMLLVAAFVALRVALLVTSYDANTNWEEPVFLFSANELQRDGLGRIFDHQDDLNHGGSVVLLLLAVPWVAAFGTSLLVLKGVAIAWSTATLVAFLWAGWIVSPRAALIFGTCFLLASPTLASLGVTLVGSHSESLLPCALALGTYLRWIERRPKNAPWRDVGLGFWGGVATWISYVALGFVVPLLGARAAFGRDPRGVARVAAGFLVGMAPWALQNLWLRPHGAWSWRSHVAGAVLEPSRPPIVVALARSYGWADGQGMALLALCVAALAWATVRVVRRPTTRPALLPFVATACLGLAMLAAARLPTVPAEGYYQYRFYVVVQVALFWILALALDHVASGRPGIAVLVAGLAAAALVGQSRMLQDGISYIPSFAADRERGCLVFGVAEGARAGSWTNAVRALTAIRDRRCAERAFGGLGWTLADRFAATRDVAATADALRGIPDPDLRWAACGGFAFVVSRKEAVAAADWAPLREDVCRRPAR